FFSSRRRHTISKRDWSSDVCSSDLPGATKVAAVNLNKNGTIDQDTWHYRDDEIPDMTGFWEEGTGDFMWPEGTAGVEEIGMSERSEERRVGKECRSSMSAVYHNRVA